MSPTQFLMIHTIIANCQRWQEPQPRKEPLTYNILQAAYLEVQSAQVLDRHSYPWSIRSCF